MASTALPGIVFAFWLLFPCIFIVLKFIAYFFNVLLCDPQGVPVANKYQMGLDADISSSYYQE